MVVFLYTPYVMDSNFILVNGVKTHYFHGGTGDKLVILHGWNPRLTLEESYRKLIEKLERKCEVYVLALPGFDQSDFPPLTGWTTDDYGLWLEQILKALKLENPGLYGHSFGCRVIIRFLRKHPEFKGKIILTGAAGIKWGPRGIRQKLLFGVNKICPGFKKIFRNYCPAKLRPFILGKLLGAHDWALVPAKLEKTLQRTLAEPDFRDELPHIKQQTLLIWGRNDAITPLRSAQVFAHLLPHNELKIISDGRHGIHKTHPKKISEYVLKFLHEK